MKIVTDTNLTIHTTAAAAADDVVVVVIVVVVVVVAADVVDIGSSLLDTSVQQTYLYLKEFRSLARLNCFHMIDNLINY